MSRDRILATLRHHAPELQAAGIAHIRLFGSCVREETTANSDIDLLVDFNENSRISLLTISRLRLQLTALLKQEVDLTCTDWLKEQLRDAILQEAVYAF